MTVEELERLWRLLDQFGRDRAYWDQYVNPRGNHWGAVIEAKRQVGIALTTAGRGDVVEALHWGDDPPPVTP